MPDPSPSTLTVLNSNFLQLGRQNSEELEDLLVTQLIRRPSNEVKVLKMDKKITSLQVKVLELFFTSLHAKSNRKLLK